MRSDRIEKLFKDVYLKKGQQNTGDMDPLWRAQVLRQIRTLSPDTGADAPLLWLFQQYLWRMAPVACALILAMGLWMTQSSLNPELDIVALSLNNPVSFSMLESFGM